jgi:hypothetical protein
MGRKGELEAILATIATIGKLSSERRNVIEEADLLRGLLLLTTFAHHGDESLTELATRFS